MKYNKEQILKKLDEITGSWQSSGKMYMDDDSQIAINGTDNYEWLPGNQFLIHRADVHVGNDKIDVIEIIGEYDENEKACTMHAFQNDGNHGVMWATMEENGSMLFYGDTIRSFLTIEKNGKTMYAKWERLENTQWIHWMDMYFSRKTDGYTDIY